MGAKDHRKFVAIGMEVPLSEVINVDFRSRTSLADGDAIIVAPSIGEYASSYHGFYKGKRSLNERDSFRFVEDAQHWRREIRESAESGKFVFVFVKDLEEVYVDTGERQFSGTGRNRVTTTVVAPEHNYKVLPLKIELVNSIGTEARLAKGSEWLAIYWSAFARYSQYRATFSCPSAVPALTTRTQERVVGASLRTKAGGAIVLLPSLLDDAPEQFAEAIRQRRRARSAAEPFWRALVAALVGIENAIRAAGETTPPPDWTKVASYDTEAERSLRRRVFSINESIAQAEAERQELLRSLDAESALRGLLFEKGLPLEVSIRASLRLMGFDAASFSNSESEFDVVFSSLEGRFLGEAEGRDHAAVSIDKFRQLESNIQEDFARDEVTEPAKAVLFGNAFRLDPVEGRGDFFTAKCLSAARRVGAALVRTPDLFHVARYLRDHSDEPFAHSCRLAILTTEGGVVTFPSPPVSDTGATQQARAVANVESTAVE